MHACVGSRQYTCKTRARIVATTTVVSAERERARLRFSRVPHSPTMNIASIATTTALPWGKDLDAIARSNFGHGDNNTLPATCNRFLEIVPGGQVDSARVGSLSSEDKPIWTQLPQRHLALLWTRATCKTSFISSSLPNPLQPTCMRSPQRPSLFKGASWRPQTSEKLSVSVAAA